MGESLMTEPSRKSVVLRSLDPSKTLENVFLELIPPVDILIMFLLNITGEGEVVPVDATESDALMQGGHVGFVTGAVIHVGTVPPKVLRDQVDPASYQTV